MPVESTPTIRLDDPPATAPSAPVQAAGLTRVEVARGSDVEPVMRASRSAVAALSSRLEGALEEASAAEAAVGDMTHDAAVEAEWNASLQVIHEEVQERRARRDHELEAARREAAEQVAAARAHAAAVLQQANDALTTGLAGHASAETPPPAAVAPVAAVAPQGVPPFVAVMVPAPDGSGQPTYVLAPTVGMANWAAMPPVPAPTAPVAPISYPSYPAYPPYQGPVAPAPGPGQVLEARPRPTVRGGLSRMLHLDVVLPLIAVIIVIAILLAWLG